jgi:hypothetical protein
MHKVLPKSKLWKNTKQTRIIYPKLQAQGVMWALPLSTFIVAEARLSIQMPQQKWSNTVAPHRYWVGNSAISVRGGTQVAGGAGQPATPLRRPAKKAYENPTD